MEWTCVCSILILYEMLEYFRRDWVLLSIVHHSNPIEKEIMQRLPNDHPKFYCYDLPNVMGCTASFIPW